LKYSFNEGALNNVKGHISECLVKQYIKENVVPSLKKEGWDYVFFNRHLHPFFNRYDSLWFYTSNGIFPNRKFIANLRKLDKLRREPDGFLIKLKKTGEMKTIKTSWSDFSDNQIRIRPRHAWNETTIIELEMRCPTCHMLNMIEVKPLQTSSKPSLWSKLPDFRPSKVANCRLCKKVIAEPKDVIPMGRPQEVTPMEVNKLPIVNGEIEVIEVKSDKAHLQAYQRKNYVKLIKNGYILHFFRVRIVSFKGNQFEILEKIVKNVNDL